MKLKTLLLTFLTVLSLLAAFTFLKSQILLSPSHPVESTDPNEIAKRYGIAFPIEELGGCKDYSECRAYCEDPANYDACLDFAKKKGFFKEEEYLPDESILKRAGEVLGCNSYDSCRSLCEKEENYDKCHQFAQSVGVAGGYRDDPRQAEILNKAKEVLGCDSYDSCKNFCENPANRDRCGQFAKSIGMYGGYEYKGPGGCTTEESCRAFCSNPSNVEICRQYSSSYGGQFEGPGGCTDEASCRAYCEKNPQACGYQGQIRDYNPEEMCKKTPSCRWEGNTCQCGFYEGVDKNYDPASECQKYGCSWTGNSCQCSQTDSQYQDRLKSECSKYPGCSWTGSSCQCSASGEGNTYTPYPTGVYQGDPATECAKQTGCSWTGSSCQCSDSSGSYSPPSSYDPATECAKQSGCSWTGSTCQCSSSGGSSEATYQPSPTPSSGVQGFSTFTSWFSSFWQYLRGLFGRY